MDNNTQITTPCWFTKRGAWESCLYEHERMKDEHELGSIDGMAYGQGHQVNLEQGIYGQEV